MLGNVGSSSGCAGALEGRRATVGRPVGSTDHEMFFSGRSLRSVGSSGRV